MSKEKIIIVGSANIDMIVKSKHIPTPGETVLGGEFVMIPGGKGANQAVAVARLGGESIFIAKVGNDIFGKQSLQAFDEEGINISDVLSDPISPSGIALITVDEEGENSIVVAPGANAKLKTSEVEKALAKNLDARILLMQLEIPMETVKSTIHMAHQRGIQVILDPAPCDMSVLELLPLAYILTPNRTEAEMLSGMKIGSIEEAERAAAKISEQGIEIVIITLGERGALLYAHGEGQLVECPKVVAIDTTAAGDIFNGALAVALSEGKSLLDSVRFACQAATISVTRMGAQSSVPNRKDLVLHNFEDILKK